MDMQFTHTEAHQLIQYNLDHALNSAKQKTLFAHLQECDACRAYADGMYDMENVLHQVMNKQWNHPPLPLSIDSIRPQNIFQKSAHSLFGLRTALISIVVVAFSFLIWQLRTTVYDSSEQISLSLAPVPTPSIQLSTASIESPKCEWSLHKVDELDTLDSIAQQYSVSKDEIIIFNKMNSDLIYETMELKIPQCNPTPTVTAHMPTTTLTPILELTIDTPG
ncbi:MAG: LysM peptidoglycan-binding domain-containing protein [Anaerolineae bacterium]|nr:LysM peptidoglycan-binding domain-containing protein [Anaerolineae bacterium]